MHRRVIKALHEEDVEAPIIAAYISCSEDTVTRWMHRIDQGEGLEDKPRSGRPAIYQLEDQFKVTAFYCQTTPFADGGRWTLRFAAKFLKNHPDRIGISPSKATLARILQMHGIKPHRNRYFLHISDPDFFPKMEMLTEVYLARHPFLYCYDECPGIQILQRLAPAVLSGMTEKRQQTWLEEFEYIRHGTMDVLAFLDVNSGRVDAQCRADHTKSVFLDVFRSHMKPALIRAGDEKIHYILDNLAAHYSYDFCQLKAELCGIECPPKKELATGSGRRSWLGDKTHKIIITFTPFHGSWLNMIEIWFGIMNQHCLKNSSYASPQVLKEAIEDFIRFWNEELAHAFEWKYDGEGLHEKAVERFIRMLSTSAAGIPVKSLLKYLKLMYNLKTGYEDKIDGKVWDKLRFSLYENEEILRDLILEDTSPRRKENAQKALNMLIEKMKQKPQAKLSPAA